MEPSQMQKDCKHQFRNEGFVKNNFIYAICEECGAELTSNDLGKTWQQVID